APDATNFSDTAEVAFNGHGSMQLDVKTSQNSQTQISGDDLSLTTTQSFSIEHKAEDADRQNVVSHTSSFVTISFCTTKKSSFLFSASGQLAVPPDTCTAPSCQKTPFANAFVLATFACPGCPQIANQQFFVGVNVAPAANGVPTQPSGAAQ